jgi:hypothetical protein
MPARDGSVRPLLLASYGRSGSTMLAGALAAHPEIVARRLFPFETRAMQYFFVCALEGRSRIDFLPAEHQGAQYAPWQDGDPLAHEYEALLASGEDATGAHALERAGRYYARVLEAEGKESAAFIAEKAIGLGLTRFILETVPVARAVLLRRDPRDVFLSVKSFNAKRGHLSFGEEHGDEALFRNIIGFYREAEALRRIVPSQICTLSYERLIAEPEAALRELCLWLGVDASAPTLAAMREEMFRESGAVTQHRTSGSREDSAGRWQREGDPRIRALFECFSQQIAESGF